MPFSHLAKSYEDYAEDGSLIIYLLISFIAFLFLVRRAAASRTVIQQTAPALLQESTRAVLARLGTRSTPALPKLGHKVGHC